jgi:hypothetical protein
MPTPPSAPPAITFWNRLEPRARSNDLTNALAARVRDPAWFLARQWQLGEFNGEDAASPAYLKLSGNTSRVAAWASVNGPANAIDAAVPPERAVTQEPFSPDDVSARVELGQVLEDLFLKEGVSDLATVVTDYRLAYPIAAAANDDPRAARLRALWQGRALDGVAVYQTIKPLLPGITPLPPPAVSDEVHVRAALQQFCTWVEQVCGAPVAADPTTWRPERLEYLAKTYAGVPATGSVAELRTDPDREGQLPWHAFDEIQVLGSPPPGVPAPTSQEFQTTVLPALVRFRGMPNTRFWDFEDGRIDFGGVTPDRRDIASLILMDFMLIHGTDWFLIPFEMDVGSVCKATVTVTDVFGHTTTVDRADSGTGPRWTMFSTFHDDGSDGTLADYFLLPASVATAAQDGPTVEEVRFLRDDLANLIWAVEHDTEGHLGRPVPGADRGTTEPPPEEPFTSPLRYRLQTYVPRNWTPFQPVKLNASTHEIAFVKSVMLGPEGNIEPDPRGKILQPQGLAGAYQIREEEVPREGTRVARTIRCSRWVDGTTHVWVSRRRSVGRGEGSSGLRFDIPLTPK